MNAMSLSELPTSVLELHTHGRGGEDIGIDRRNWFGSGVKLGVNYWSLGGGRKKACPQHPKIEDF
jgi:hypothetical protein